MKARHRVPSLGSRLRRYEDPTRSRDPRIRAVVAHLQAVELPAPSATFRSELRAQLVAVAPRLIEDGVAEQRQATRTRAGESRAAKAAEEPDTARRKLRFGRPLAVLTTLVAVCALVLGGAVWLSQKSLPGDTLYGLKRASESWQLALDTNDTDKATDYLHFSQTRVEEAQDLLHRSSASGGGVQADGTSSATANQLNSTLAAADEQLVDGWKLLAATATSSHSATPLATMKNWAPGQIDRLDRLSADMPTKALRLRAEKSTGLAHFALDSAHKLTAKLDKPSSAPAGPASRTAKKHTSSGRGTRTGAGSAPTHPSARKASTANRPAPKATTAPAKRRHTASPAPPSTPKALLPSAIRSLVPTHLPLVSSCGISLPGGIKVGHCRSRS